MTVTGSSLPAKNLSRCDRKIFVPKDNSNRSNVTVPTGDRKKITNKVHEKSGDEETVDSRNANKCNVLFVVHNGIATEGVVGFKIANN